MTTITALTLYPIKSCAGIDLHAATITATGLFHHHVHDREWMVVDSAGQFLSQRSHAVMALIVPTLQADTMTLHGPGMPPLTIQTAPLNPQFTSAIEVNVWNDTVTARDCGDSAAAWFSRILDLPCRLVRFDPEVTRLADKKWTNGTAVPTRFSDGFPILLVSQGSLDDLNQKLQAQGRAALPMNRFRPNIVIDGVDAFEEDFVAAIRAGQARLQPVKPCARCPIPSIDQATGQFGPDPMDMLRTYRSNPRVNGGITFGINTILQAGAGEVLRTGQQIDVELAF